MHIKAPLYKEKSGQNALNFPLQAVGDAFNDGIYDEQARLRGIPLLESKPKYEMRNMIAKEACGSGRVNIILNFFIISFCPSKLCFAVSFTS